MGVKTLQRRLAKVEQKMLAGQRFARWVDMFEADVKVGIAEGKLDEDLLDIAHIWRRWIERGITVKV